MCTLEQAEFETKRIVVQSFDGGLVFVAYVPIILLLIRFNLAGPELA